LKRALSGNRHPVAVIGTGFTGCEVASSLREIGRDVIVVGRSSTLMSSLLGPELGQQLTDLHRHHEVNLELGVTVEGWAHGTHSVGLRLSNGKTVEAACVVVAVGSVPTVEWLRDADVKIDNGVVCDATCHVAGLDDVVAAGDVAVWPNLRFDHRARQNDHWLNAIEMGRAAAENLLAGRHSARPFMPVPRFWSEQHGVRIHAVGVPALGTRRVALQDRSRGGRSVTGYVRDGRLMGVVGFNSSAAVVAYADELNRQEPVTSTDQSMEQAPRRRMSFQEAARAARR
jgi:NADPH-dependent 2,4-dienoyl-CoA reductase/sulfur reductase-like enzyme